MRKKTIVIAFLIFLGLSFGLVVKNYSQPSGDTSKVISNLENRKECCEEEIIKWERKKNMILILTCGVGILGMVAAALQAINMSWRRTATVIIGIFISGLTFVHDNAYKMDRHTLSNIIKQGKDLMVDIEIELGRIPKDDAAREMWLDKMGDKFKKFNGLSFSIAYLPKTESKFNLMPVLYALPQEQLSKEPSWIAKPPHDYSNIYFIGIGDSHSIDRAERLSNFHVSENISNYLTLLMSPVTKFREEKGDTDYLIKKIVNSTIKAADTYFYFNKGEMRYRFYSLRMLNKKNITVDFEIYGARYYTFSKQDSLSPEFEKTSSPYYESTLKNYSFFYNSLKKTLNSEQYENFMEARLARMEGNYGSALEILKSLVYEMPQFFYGWYELASIYSSINDILSANEAFERAADLRNAQFIQDTSFLNSYGIFLYRHGKPERSVQVLKESLNIDRLQPLVEAFLGIQTRR